MHWTSSDPETVSVNDVGKITALKCTEANKPVIITVTTDDLGFTDTCEITVTPIRATGVAVQPTAKSLENGRTQRLIATVAPLNADDRTVVWSSSNEAVATVDENGLVTAKASSGSAVITATTSDGGFTASCTITAIPVRISKVELSAENVEVMRTNTVNVTAALSPIDAEYATIEWISADTATATVADTSADGAVSGTITGVKLGTTAITLKVTDYTGAEFTDVVYVTVKPIAANTLTLNHESTHQMRTGKVEVFTLTPDPLNADIVSCTWTKSSDAVTIEQIANEPLSVRVIAGATAGTARVSAQVNDGYQTRSIFCDITVSEAISVNVSANHELNTVGNDIVWTASAASAIGEVSYQVSVKKDSVDFTAFTASGSTYTIQDAAAGTYEITVVATDTTGESDTATNTVTVSESITFRTFASEEYSYVIIENGAGAGKDGAAVKLVSAAPATVTIPAYMHGTPVTRIDTEAFMNQTALQRVNMPNTVKVIGARAFKGCTSLNELEPYAP